MYVCIYICVYVCVFLYLCVSLCVYVYESESHSVVSDSLRPRGLWNSPGQNTEVCSLSLLQGIFPTQGPNPGLSHCKQILYQMSYKGSPRILEWVAYPFSRGSSQSRNWTRVSCIACGFFTNWAIREARQFSEVTAIQSTGEKCGLTRRSSVPPGSLGVF